MRPKICKDNGVKIPTSDCSTCDILEQKVDALTEELETKQDLLTAGNHIEISEDAVISANLDEYYDKTEVNMLIQGVANISFAIVDELPETGAGNVIYLVPDGNAYDQYVYSNGEWVAIGSTAIDLTDYVKFTNAASVTPLMDGTGAIGVSTDYARADHVHPTDTTRAALASPNFTGTPKAPTNSTASTATTQIATTAFTQNAITRRIPKTIVSVTNTANPASGTFGTLQKYTAPSTGTFIGLATADFDANATGQRRVDALLDGNGIGSWVKVSASNGGHTSLSTPIITRMSANQDVQLQTWQNSGSALSVTVYLKGIFIAD